jgi:2-hydroxychromene-2-carboxylate isomerase
MMLKTRIKSLAMGLMASSLKRNTLRNIAGVKRKIAGRAPCVHYFHQVDDPYSHLVVQRLGQLQANYDLSWITHLVSQPENAYQGDPDRFREWALADAISVAPDYGVHIPPTSHYPPAGSLRNTNDMLMGSIGRGSFVEDAIKIGDDLWLGNLAESVNEMSAGVIGSGNSLRQKLGHYLSATFYFEGEWYWGLDRLYLLEARLIELGFKKGDSDELCVPRPRVSVPEGLDAADITLEYFPSLRSPYTAIGHQRIMDLVSRSGVKLVMRPVMPMMMRGVPAPRAKQLYIMSDAAREAVAAGVKFGNFVDPFGEPVKRAFSLYPWLVRQGKEREFVTLYLQAAWADGIDICSDLGLRHIVEAIGLTWAEALEQFDNEHWEPLLEDNVESMLSMNLWGVPSFRVSGGNNPVPYSCWGQDRIWRVASEIIRRSNKDSDIVSPH